jgi:hypothetical protein
LTRHSALSLMRQAAVNGPDVPLPLLRDQRQRGEAPSHAELRYRIEAEAAAGLDSPALAQWTRRSGPADARLAWIGLVSSAPLLLNGCGSQAGATRRRVDACSSSAAGASRTGSRALALGRNRAQRGALSAPLRFAARHPLCPASGDEGWVACATREGGPDRFRRGDDRRSAHQAGEPPPRPPMRSCRRPRVHTWLRRDDRRRALRAGCSCCGSRRTRHRWASRCRGSRARG